MAWRLGTPESHYIMFVEIKNRVEKKAEGGGSGQVGGGGELSILVQPGLGCNASTSKWQGTWAASRGKRAGPHRLWGARLSLSRPCSHRAQLQLGGRERGRLADPATSSPWTLGPARVKAGPPCPRQEEGGRGSHRQQAPWAPLVLSCSWDKAVQATNPSYGLSTPAGVKVGTGLAALRRISLAGSEAPARVQKLAPARLPNGCVTLGKSLHLSGLQMPHRLVESD